MALATGAVAAGLALQGELAKKAAEKAAKDAGHDVTVPFTPGRMDASEEQTDVESMGVLEPIADGFRNYLEDGHPISAEDLLVDNDLVERISTGGRAFYYGLAPNERHQPHPHFYCKSCGQMDCLNPESLNVETEPLWKNFPGRIDKVEVRVDGICKKCM